jgi:hypothetical protein
MNPIEQRIQDAAPQLDPGDPSLSLEELQILAPASEPEQLTPGNAGIYRNAGVRHRRHWRHGSARSVLGFVPLAMILLMGILQMVPPASQDADEDTANAATPEPGLLWRAVTVTRPWATGPQLSASFDLPAEWQVRRHRPSTDFPGLHATVLDEDGLAVAMLYVGPAPAGALAWECGQFPASDEELDRQEVQTGAEILDPGLTTAYRYALETGQETRGTFGLIPGNSRGAACSTGLEVGPAGQLVVLFGDALRVPTAKAPRVPRSGYARTFADADPLAYLASAEYAQLRRMVTSLHVELPADTSYIWDVATGKPPGHW